MDSILGPLAAFASSFTWAIGVTAYYRLSTVYLPASINITRALIALPLALLFAAYTLGGIAPIWQGLLDVSAFQVGWLILSMFAGYAFGDALFLFSTRSIGVPAALAIASCYPFWSALGGFLFLGEKLTTYKALGLAAAVGGTVIVILSGRKRTATQSIGPRSYWTGVALAILTSLFWGLNAYATSVGGRDLPIAIATVLRLSIALILCPIIAFFMTRRFVGPVALSDMRRYILIFMLEGFGGAMLYMYGLSHSPIAVGSALSALSAAISAPIAWLTGAEKFSLAKSIGIIVALIGIVLLVAPR